MGVQDRRRASRRLAALAGCAVLAVGIAACGDDEDETTADESASAEEVTVTTADTADGYTWEVEPTTPTADTTSITFMNDSEEPHALIFARINEGFTVEEAYKLEGEKGSADVILEEGAGPGKSGSFEIKKPIEPGNYVLLCPISGKDGPHYKLGQLSEFEIQ